MLNRRNFLQASSLALGASSLAPFSALAADQSGYKALVCVFLAGGADCHDILIGHDQASYDQWAASRQTIINQFAAAGNPGARSRDNLLQLNPLNQADFGSRQFAMPPEMAPLKALFDQGSMAFVPNVGPLIQPLTQQEAIDRTAPRPPRLRSHNDQQSTWQSFGVEGTQNGWGGLVLDAVAQSSPYAAISASGQSVFLTGQGTTHLQVSDSQNVQTAWGTGDGLFGSQELSNRIASWYGRGADGLESPLARDLFRSQAAAINDSAFLQDALLGETLGQSVRIERNELAEQLAAIADLIAVRDKLGVSRQVFFAQTGGFDTHNDQAMRLPARLSLISEAIAGFQAAIESAGLADSVTLFTASDFGRTLQSNATGTDHGWGGHHMVVGGAVRGNRIHGAVPEFQLGHDRDLKRGTLIPDISVEQYGSELGRWFGLTESELNAVFARRSNFDTTALQLF